MCRIIRWLNSELTTSLILFFNSPIHKTGKNIVVTRRRFGLVQRCQVGEIIWQWGDTNPSSSHFNNGIWITWPLPEIETGNLKSEAMTLSVTKLFCPHVIIQPKNLSDKWLNLQHSRTSVDKSWMWNSDRRALSLVGKTDIASQLLLRRSGISQRVSLLVVVSQIHDFFLR